MSNNCEFCQIPTLNAKFRLMEAHYHEDMNELYRRLEALEQGRAGLVAPSAGAKPIIHYPRQQPAHHLACHTCHEFRVEDVISTARNTGRNFRGCAKSMEWRISLKIYLVQHRVDLGVQVVSAWKNKDKANQECRIKNDEYTKKYPWMGENNYFVKEIVIE